MIRGVRRAQSRLAPLINANIFANLGNNFTNIHLKPAFFEII